MRTLSSQVRDLYKRIVTVGADYPAGLDYIRKRAKAEFSKRKDITDDVELKRAVNYGRYMVKEMIGVRHAPAAHLPRAHVTRAHKQMHFLRPAPLQPLLASQVIQLKKYRSIRSRYREPEPETPTVPTSHNTATPS